MKVCNYQIAALLKLYLHVESPRYILFILGTRFRYPRGRAFNSISPLTNKLVERCGVSTADAVVGDQSQQPAPGQQIERVFIGT